jgi:UDP-N-acetylmuramyl pentapeptide phosphotransferase/UDP-N-acetylglucosamine-1-phosphate transferase
VLVATFTRAVGVLLVPLTVVTEAVFVRDDTSENRRRVWTVFAIGFVAAMLVHAYFFHDMRRWPTDFMRPKLEEYAAREQAGEVVWDRAETAHARPESMLGHVAIEADRFVRFFQVTVAGFSRAHNAYAILYYIPLYGLALIGILDALLGVDERRRAVVHVTLLWILSMAALCAVTILDFDWRYRMPLLPQLIVLAACGAEAVGRRVTVLRPQPRFAAR